VEVAPCEIGYTRVRDAGAEWAASLLQVSQHYGSECIADPHLLVADESCLGEALRAPLYDTVGLYCRHVHKDAFGEKEGGLAARVRARGSSGESGGRGDEQGIE